jgi:hypothetical protein
VIDLLLLWENQRLNFKLIKSIKSDKIKIIETVGWKRSEKVGESLALGNG